MTKREPPMTRRPMTKEEQYREKIPDYELDDMVNNPSHYGQGTIECIEYIKDFLSRDEYIGYLRGNIAKYLHRWRYKNGVEDLKKARWYLSELIAYEDDSDVPF